MIKVLRRANTAKMIKQGWTPCKEKSHRSSKKNKRNANSVEIKTLSLTTVKWETKMLLWYNRPQTWLVKVIIKRSTRKR